ncbi:sodium-dependent glucose transporter 1-like [Panonychus citri]|uniref:sodium-dependent glucose transporter 1-like n=1 Tax=Panonychus citri TaxID=50023 RepID=UPI002307D79A|nr:sodium-dependent glucose transporter 1-like [Panonychus citri]
MELIKFVKTNKYKIFKTLLTYLTFAGLGGVNTLMGSSLLDLQIKVQTSFSTVSKLVPARAIGYVLGASSCGLYEKRIDDYLILSISNFIAGLFLILAPWFNIIELIFASIIISGFAQGVFDIYCNVIILRIWGKHGVNWLQVLHMCFGVGALITPIFTRPFLLPNTESDDTTVILANGTSVNSTQTSQYTPEDVKVQYSFMIVGGMLFIVSIPFFFCYLHDRKTNSENSAEPEAEEIQSNASTTKKVCAVIMTGILANFAFGTEAVVGNLCTAFAVKADIKMDKKTAVLIATVFWSMFSFYRLIFIPMTLFIKEGRLFVLNLFIILAGTFVLVPKAASQSTFTWIAFILLGIGYSPVFSISYGSLGKYFPITNAMTSYIFVNGVIGETIHTTILSKFIETKPIIFTYYLGAMSILYVIIS